MKKLVSILMVLSVLGIVLAGCSGGSSDSGSATPDKGAAPAGGTDTGK